jgi:hypothetical protein
MLKYLLSSLLIIISLTFPVLSQEPSKAKTPSASATPQAVEASANKVTGLELPIDQTVSFDEGFVPILAQCKGEVKWLVVSQVKVKYITMPGNSIIISVPPQGGTISVFAVGIVDGKFTEFAKTNITVTPGAIAQNPPGPNPPGPVQGAGPLHITFIVDLNNTTPEMASVLNSQAIQQAVRNKGNYLRLYDMRSPVVAQKKLDQVVQKVGGSAVMVIQNNTGLVLQALPVPRTEQEVLAIISQFGG